MNDQHDFEIILRSRFPIVVVETHEEPRLLNLLERVSRLNDEALFAWSVTDGLRRRDRAAGGPIPMTDEPTAVLRHVAATPQNGIYALLDFHPYLENPLNVRLLREIALSYARTARTIVLVSHEVKLSPELRPHSARFELSIPDQAVIRSMINEEVQLWRGRNPGQPVKAEREAFELMVQHLSGMLTNDARRLIRQAIEDDQAFTRSDVDRIVSAKHQLLGRDGVLTFQKETANFADVAGQQNFKRWLNQRREAFIGDASALNLESPKGVLLIGVQGGGKSLAAKAVAGHWGLPLLRLDFGTLYNRWLGETERNLREALRIADAMSPCVLWIDELEKGIGGDSHDDGVSRRVLGALLTWMAERRSRVFLVATANDISALPPELVRKGRFDEIFFVDLPDSAVRAEIFRVHLRRRQLDVARFDIRRLASASEGFSGAEIEQAVVSALYQAHAENKPVASGHVLGEIQNTRPLSLLMAEKIAALRDWARDRTVRAD